MKKAFVWWVLVLSVLSACASDDALITDVQKVVEVKFELNPDRDVQDSGVIDISEVADIVSEEFQEYQDAIRDFHINGLSFQIEGYEPIPGTQMASFDSLLLKVRGLDLGATPIDMLDLRNVAIMNMGQPLVLYLPEENNSADLQNAMNFIRSKLIKEEAFRWQVVGAANGVWQSFEIKFFLDLSAEVILGQD